MPDDRPSPTNPKKPDPSAQWRWWELRPQRRMLGSLRDPVCDECGYSLRGLGLDGRCPECGNAFNLGTGAGAREHDALVDPKLGLWLKVAFWVCTALAGSAIVFGCILACFGWGPMVLVMFVVMMAVLFWWAFTGQLDIDVRFRSGEDEG
jgi:hypothetical protein